MIQIKLSLTFTYARIQATKIFYTIDKHTHTHTHIYIYIYIYIYICVSLSVYKYMYIKKEWKAHERFQCVYAFFLPEKRNRF